MEGFTRFCQLTLITVNIIAMVKSVELTFLGASLYVLDPLVIMVVEHLTFSDTKAVSMLHRLTLFMLILGPLILPTGVAGLCGAYRKSTGWLSLYMALLILMITAILTLCAIEIPTELASPGDKWRPLSDFLLTCVVILLASLGVLIFFTIILMSNLAADENKVHPETTPMTARSPPRPRPRQS